MTTYVIDASAGVDLLLDTPAGREVEALVDRDATWWVPEHYYAEVLSLLRRITHEGILSAAEAEQFVSRLSRSTMHRVSLRTLVQEAWTLRHNVTPYDAFYVVVARHLGATLVTTDKRLRRAPNLGVPILPPLTDR